MRGMKAVQTYAGRPTEDVMQEAVRDYGGVTYMAPCCIARGH